MEGLTPLEQSPGSTSYELSSTTPAFLVQERWIQAQAVAEMDYSAGLGNGEPVTWEENGRLRSGSCRVWGLIPWGTMNKWRGKWLLKLADSIVMRTHGYNLWINVGWKLGRFHRIREWRQRSASHCAYGGEKSWVVPTWSHYTRKIIWHRHSCQRSHRCQITVLLLTTL